MAEAPDDELLIRVDTTEQNSAMLERGLEEQLRRIDFHLDKLREAGAEFKAELQREVPEQIEARRRKILADREMVESLGFPIRRRRDAPRTYKVPMTRKKPKVLEPKPSTGDLESEPELAMEVYEDIISILKNMVTVIEQSPEAFKEMKEELLRSHFLVQLNGQYEGRATGETFNANGRADIIIKEGNRNLFIAECKFWGGSKKLVETLDQLLKRYLTWRDTKVAVLIFNRNRDFSAVVEKIKKTLPKHPLCIKKIGDVDESTSRYLFHHPDDKKREIILTVLAFDVPS